MKILGFFFVLFSINSYAVDSLEGSWSSRTGTLCESSGEVIERWESLTFKNENKYTQFFSFSFPGNICLGSYTGDYTKVENGIIFGIAVGYVGCNGKRESIEIDQRKASYTLEGDDLIITVPSENCGFLKTIYKKVH
jgi:hypothetical protein